MLNWLARYQQIIDVLDGAQAGSVLDVGSGYHGLSWYWPHHVVQTDLNVETGAETHDAARAGTADLVQANADDLPFDDRSFDWVISSDMVEHLPAAIRAKSISELTRVARHGVIVGHPVSPDGPAMDRLLDRLVPLLRIGEQPWLAEHLEQPDFPTRTTVPAAVPAGWTVERTLTSGNRWAQFGIVIADLWPPLSRVAGVLEARYRRRAMPLWVNRGRVIRYLYVLKPLGDYGASNHPKTLVSTPVPDTAEY